MNIPKGMSENQEYCLQSKKTIYWLIQSAREFYKKLILVLKSIVFVENNSDPCLLLDLDKQDFIFIGISMTVLSLGKKSASNGWLLNWKGILSISRFENYLKDYLSCHTIEYKESNQNMTFWTCLIKKLHETFGNEVLEKTIYRTQGTPRFKVIRPNQDTEF
jgi:hypothetical protein